MPVWFAMRDNGVVENHEPRLWSLSSCALENAAGLRKPDDTHFDARPMNDEKKGDQIRGLLEDISSNNDPSRLQPRGLINIKLLDRVTFFASILSLLLIAVAILAMIWQTIDEVFGFRFVASTVVVMITLLIFRFINSQFE
jgi:hypothetical protein